MPDVKPIAPVRIGGTDIVYAQGMKAGSWLFFTGHEELTDFETGIAAASRRHSRDCRLVARRVICAKANTFSTASLN